VSKCRSDMMMPTSIDVDSVDDKTTLLPLCTVQRRPDTISLRLVMPPPVGSVFFVRPSVRPSVAYIANNSRTQRPSVPKFRRKVPHL